jgi:hypothetical protein
MQNCAFRGHDEGEDSAKAFHKPLPGVGTLDGKSPAEFVIFFS